MYIMIGVGWSLVFCSGIEAIQEECLAALKHKTPSVKSETAAYLARCFARCPPLLTTNKKVSAGKEIARYS